MINISQAFILAAGRGERMKPLTDTIPKPLAKIKDKAMIDYIIDKVSAVPSINKIVVNCYYLAEILEAHLKSLNNHKIIISHETEKLETGGGLVNAMPFFDDTQPILIINGDIFWSDEHNSLLEKIIENFDEKNMDILLAMKPREQFFGYEGKGDFDLKKGGSLLNKGSEYYSHTYIGVQIIHPRILKNYPAEKCQLGKSFSLGYFFKRNEKLKGVEVEERIFHIGTVKTLEEINNLLGLTQEF